MSEYAKNIQTIEDLWKKRIGLREGGGRMSDYIITCDDEVAGWVGNDVESMRPLVRCRDCRYFNAPNKCRRYGNFSRARENGFCAWGEREDGDAR